VCGTEYAWIDPVHGLGDDAAGYASLEEAPWRWLLVVPVLDEVLQREPG
jgi:hypothetical protein